MSLDLEKIVEQTGRFIHAKRMIAKIDIQQIEQQLEEDIREHQLIYNKALQLLKKRDLRELLVLREPREQHERHGDLAEVILAVFCIVVLFIVYVYYRSVFG